MSLTLKDNADANVTYTLLRDSSSGTNLDRRYYGASHTDISKDLLVLKSTDPKRVTGSYGVRRSSASYYKTYAITNPNQIAESKDLKVEINISVPIGAGLTPGTGNVSSAQYLEACARIQAYITSEAYMTSIGLLGVSPD
jgi:hypothetical protein